MLYLGPIGMYLVTSELCYIGTILQRILFVKIHGNKLWEPQHDRVISKSVL